MAARQLRNTSIRYKALNVCDVDYSQSLRQILDSERDCDCDDDMDNAYLYSNECDKYDDEVSDD